MSESEAEDHPPTIVEWIATGISALIVLSLIGVLVWDARREHQPATFSTRVLPVQRRGESMLIPVEVTNTGDEAAKDVHVQVVLTRAGVPDSAVAELEIDWVAGSSSHRVDAVLSPVPPDGTMRAHVRGYTEP